MTAADEFKRPHLVIKEEHLLVWDACLLRPLIESECFPNNLKLESMYLSLERFKVRHLVPRVNLHLIKELDARY